MKTIYLDCGMGAAGDMLTAALLELLPEPDKMIDRFNALGLPGVRFEREKAVKCGIVGTHISVTVHGEEEHSRDVHSGEEHSRDAHGEEEHSRDVHGGEEHRKDAHGHEHGHGGSHSHTHTHHHSSLQDIEHIVRDHLAVSDRVKEDVMAVYGMIADAESRVHGVPAEEVHFHEVGTMDALADVTAVCMLMEELAPELVAASPVHVGSGQVQCAHGILPVPAPATAYILQGIPTYGGSIRGELCTPTGAALLKYFAARFGDMPVMAVQAVGYGCGRKDFEAANCVRALLGETSDTADAVVELTCSIDDMTPEAIGFAAETLFAAGALEVYTVPIGMKKSRPGILLCAMCRMEDRDRIVRLIFQHTATIGIREQVSRRCILKRTIETVETPYGPVRKKVSCGYGVRREKYEYEDIAEIARKTGQPIPDILNVIAKTDEKKEEI